MSDAEVLDRELSEFEKLLSVLGISGDDRKVALKGARMFYELGWPSNHVTAGMALKAGEGLFPDRFEGLGSVGDYRKLMNSPTAYYCGSCGREYVQGHPVTPCCGAAAHPKAYPFDEVD